jgi:hypothetical protein
MKVPLEKEKRLDVEIGFSGTFLAWVFAEWVALKSSHGRFVMELKGVIRLGESTAGYV